MVIEPAACDDTVGIPKVEEPDVAVAVQAKLDELKAVLKLTVMLPTEL
jgi:hypothetical protein